MILAYWFARGLGWRDRRLGIGAGALAGFAALTAPAMLVRNDLKQYTADAGLSLAVLVLTSRLEQSWSRRRLVVLAIGVPIGMLFSHPTAFVGAAAFGAVGLVQLAHRDWSKLRDTLVAAAGAGAAMLGVYQVFDAQAVVPGLTNYWRAYYIPTARGFGASVDMVRKVLAAVRPFIGLGPTWLVILLSLAGVVTIAGLGRAIIAVTLVLLGPEMLAVSALKRYPLFDLRTSTFLLVLIVVTAAIGVCGLCSLLARWNIWFAALLAAAAVATSLTQTHTYLRGHTIPKEDVRSQARYVAEHRGSDDIVLVNLNSNWGFGYYWHLDAPARRPNTHVLQGYVTFFPADPRIVVADDRTPEGVSAALAQAVRELAQRPEGRIWLVRTHVIATEAAAWRAALQDRGLSAEPTGPAGLVTLTPG